VLFGVGIAVLTLLSYLSERIPGREATGSGEVNMTNGSRRSSVNVVQNGLKSILNTLWGVGCGLATSMAAPS
jgi:hypothetical protein